MGKSAVDLARELLQEYGGLRPLLEASQAEFCKGLGLGAAKYAQLQAVLEMGRRHLSASMKEGDLLTSPDLVRNYLSAQLRHQPQEIFAILFLDNQHRLIAYDEIFYGTIDGAAVYPREVVKRHSHVTQRPAYWRTTIRVGLLSQASQTTALPAVCKKRSIWWGCG